MITNDTKKQGDTGSPAFLLGNLPKRFQPDDGVDSRLVGFPVNLLYSQIADPKEFLGTARNSTVPGRSHSSVDESTRLRGRDRR